MAVSEFRPSPGAVLGRGDRPKREASLQYTKASAPDPCEVVLKRALSCWTLQKAERSCVIAVLCTACPGGNGRPDRHHPLAEVLLGRPHQARPILPAGDNAIKIRPDDRGGVSMLHTGIYFESGFFCELRGLYCHAQRRGTSQAEDYDSELVTAVPTLEGRNIASPQVRSGGEALSLGPGGEALSLGQSGTSPATCARWPACPARCSGGAGPSPRARASRGTEARSACFFTRAVLAPGRPWASSVRGALPGICRQPHSSGLHQRAAVNLTDHAGAAPS
jgi:hypothetical protein